MAKKSAPVFDRFFSMAVKGATADECWKWRGAKVFGYGTLSVLGKNEKAHRVSYQIHFGPILDGLWVLHKCDNPECSNPSHLFLGTVADNVHDMMAKIGKYLPRKPYRKGPKFMAARTGEGHYRAKLTAAQVLDIREASDAGASRASLARRYGVGEPAIKRIANRATWRHLPERGCA